MRRNCGSRFMSFTNALDPYGPICVALTYQIIKELKLSKDSLGTSKTTWGNLQQELQVEKSPYYDIYLELVVYQCRQQLKLLDFGNIVELWVSVPFSNNTWEKIQQNEMDDNPIHRVSIGTGESIIDFGWMLEECVNIIKEQVLIRASEQPINLHQSESLKYYNSNDKLKLTVQYEEILTNAYVQLLKNVVRQIVYNLGYREIGHTTSKWEKLLECVRSGNENKSLAQNIYLICAKFVHTFDLHESLILWLRTPEFQNSRNDVWELEEIYNTAVEVVLDAVWKHAEYVVITNSTEDTNAEIDALSAFHERCQQVGLEVVERLKSLSISILPYSNIWEAHRQHIYNSTIGTQDSDLSILLYKILFRETYKVLSGYEVDYGFNILLEVWSKSIGPTRLYSSDLILPLEVVKKDAVDYIISFLDYAALNSIKETTLIQYPMLDLEHAIRPIYDEIIELIITRLRKDALEEYATLDMFLEENGEENLEYAHYCVIIINSLPIACLLSMWLISDSINQDNMAWVMSTRFFDADVDEDKYIDLGKVKQVLLEVFMTKISTEVFEQYESWFDGIEEPWEDYSD